MFVNGFKIKHRILEGKETHKLTDENCGSRRYSGTLMAEHDQVERTQPCCTKAEYVEMCTRTATEIVRLRQLLSDIKIHIVLVHISVPNTIRDNLLKMA